MTNTLLLDPAVVQRHAAELIARDKSPRRELIPIQQQRLDILLRHPDWDRTYEGIGLPREKWEEADARWLEIHAGETCALRPGAVEALARLSRAGVTAALVTSGSRARVERELENLRVREAFAQLVCGEDAVRKKPHPEALLLALTRLDLPPAEAAYVGDSPEDVQMAREAGVFAVGLEGGFPNAEALREARPDFLAEGLIDAVEALLRS